MNNTAKILDVLFRQESPEQLLEQIRQYPLETVDRKFEYPQMKTDWDALLIEKDNSLGYDAPQYTDSGYHRDRRSEFQDERKSRMLYRLDFEKKQFMDYAESALGGFSEDEHELQFQRRTERSAKINEAYHIPDTFLTPLLEVGDIIIKMVNGEPHCRLSQVTFWRDIYLKLGQDQVVCPYLAYLDFRDRKIDRKDVRTDFNWPAVLKTDDGSLHRMLGRGMAENHCHINGATQSFALMWCWLMNKPDKIADVAKNFGSNLQSRIIRDKEGNILSLEDRVWLAALLRTILFRAIHREGFYNKKFPGEERTEACRGNTGFSSFQAFQDEFLFSFEFHARLVDVIDCLQSVCGVQVSYPEGHTCCLDYALEQPVFAAVQNSAYRVLAGERNLVYRCSLNCLSGEFSQYERMLFKLYLMLKLAFRSEMIQANDQVGFWNFANYQDRKDVGWKDDLYFYEAIRMSMTGVLSSQPVRSLEARLGPQKTANKMINTISMYDRAERFADASVNGAQEGFLQSFNPKEYDLLPDEAEADQFRKKPYFYVLHFPKRKDPANLHYTPDHPMQCRHKELRDDVKKRSCALADALSNSQYLCGRIRGIDTCSNEVGCRPEVFAQGFRFLSGFNPEEYRNTSPLFDNPIPRLSRTYHAGEDFLDIANGLRAIDEAIFFCELHRGDRIGHALAMGVEPSVHYRTKSYSISIQKQERLDDLVWLIYRSEQLGVEIEPRLKSALISEAKGLQREIYEQIIQKHGWNWDLHDYFCSMILRGDAPELYKIPRHQKFEKDEDWKPEKPKYQDPESSEKFTTVTGYDRFGTGSGGRRIQGYRKNDTIAGLYYAYHYDWAVRAKGNEIADISVNDDYIDLMRKMQDAMQRFVERKGIIIECNPSSNVLIGTFRDYAKHPIFRFNNKALALAVGERPNPVQLHATVNTDDLGVFDTSLEFEYALLYQTLREQKNSDGMPKYSSVDILEYLNGLRKNGMEAVFPGLDD